MRVRQLGEWREERGSDFPQFSSVQEIYRLHRNIIDRLQRKREHIRWLLSEE